MVVYCPSTTEDFCNLLDYLNLITMLKMSVLQI